MAEKKNTILIFFVTLMSIFLFSILLEKYEQISFFVPSFIAVILANAEGVLQVSGDIDQAFCVGVFFAMPGFIQKDSFVSWWVIVTHCIGDVNNKLVVQKKDIAEKERNMMPKVRLNLLLILLYGFVFILYLNGLTLSRIGFIFNVLTRNFSSLLYPFKYLKKDFIDFAAY